MDRWLSYANRLTSSAAVTLGLLTWVLFIGGGLAALLNHPELARRVFDASVYAAMVFLPTLLLAFVLNVADPDK